MVWRLVLLLCLPLSIVLAQDSVTYSCTEGLLDNAPFYVSDEYKQGNKIYENLRNLENPGEIEFFLPRESIVKIDPELYEYSDDESYRVPIRVLHVADQSREEALYGDNKRNYKGRYQKKRFRTMLRGTKKLKRAKKDTLGFIHKKALRRVSDYTFMMTEDAPVFKTPGGQNVAAVALKFEMEDNSFKVKRCCLKVDEEICFDRYLITPLDQDAQEINSFYVDPLSCGYLPDTQPVPSDIAANIFPTLKRIRKNNGIDGFSIGDLELLSPLQSWKSNGRAITKRPIMSKFPFDKETGEGPFNTFHYKADDKYSSDAYLHTGVQCAFISALEKFSEYCPKDSPGCLVQLGDMYHHREWGVHMSHGRGTCFDMRPLRNDDISNFGSSLTFRSSSYSYERTKEFVRLMREAGATSVVFGDPRITSSNDGKTGNHDNHLHICFNPNSEKLKKACED